MTRAGRKGSRQRLFQCRTYGDSESRANPLGTILHKFNPILGKATSASENPQRSAGKILHRPRPAINSRQGRTPMQRCLCNAKEMPRGARIEFGAKEAAIYRVHDFTLATGSCVCKSSSLTLSELQIIRRCRHPFRIPAVSETPSLVEVIHPLSAGGIPHRTSDHLTNVEVLKD